MLLILQGRVPEGSRFRKGLACNVVGGVQEEKNSVILEVSEKGCDVRSIGWVPGFLARVWPRVRFRGSRQYTDPILWNCTWAYLIFSLSERQACLFTKTRIQNYRCLWWTICPSCSICQTEIYDCTPTKATATVRLSVCTAERLRLSPRLVWRLL